MHMSIDEWRDLLRDVETYHEGWIIGKVMFQSSVTGNSSPPTGSYLPADRCLIYEYFLRDMFGYQYNACHGTWYPMGDDFVSATLFFTKVRRSLQHVLC